MINFRYHLVSLVAVFLALALGVVMGSTVIDRAIVDSLRDRIDRVEAKADAQRAENSALLSELDRKNRYITDTAGFAATVRLAGVSLAVVAERGADGDAVADLVRVARQGGASVPGVLWVESAWNDNGRVRALADAVGTNARGAAGVRVAAWTALANRLSAVPATAADDVVARLASAGFVKLEGVDGDAPAPAAWPGAGARAVVLGVAAAGEAAPQAAAFATSVKPFVDAGVPTVAGEVYREGDGFPARGELLGAVRSTDSLSAKVSTVDDVDLVEGRVASVLASSDLGRGVVGAYGYGAGATAPVPTWWSP